MTGTSAPKALRKTLTRIKATTALIVRNSHYDLSAAGLSRSTYQQERGSRKYRRSIGKLKRLLSKAEQLACALDQEIEQTVYHISAATCEVIAYCNDFPREAEWPGAAPLRRQIAMIDKARHLTRGHT